MASTSKETLIEERMELMMVSSTQSKLRLSRFLNPSLLHPISYNHPTPTLSSSISDISSSNLYFFRLHGWRTPQNDWNAWVDRMHSLHKSTWKKAGIYHAILNSKYEIIKNQNLILQLAEKWCHETNTFVFAWGEATITLEDMIVLGGYSVLGQSVLTPVDVENNKTLTKLNQEWSAFSRSTAKKADQGPWLKRFKGDSKSEIEHEAFLVLWLSRFVFPSSYSTVVKNVFPIAVHLARGIRIALAPAVLATIYRDLTLLQYEIDFAKQELADSIKFNNYDSNDESDQSNDGISSVVTVWAPLQLVQIWIWERLPNLTRSVRNAGDSSKPWFARWDKKNLEIEIVLDFGVENFSWRPYASSGIDNLFSSKVYQEKGKGRWVEVGDGLELDEDLESWVRCLRVCELIGIDGKCMEEYRPHRVAMQFGMDQDMPGDVPQMDDSSEMAWRFYSRPIKGVKVYLPSKFYEPSVTARYLEWWNSPPPINDNDDDDDDGDDNETLEDFKLRRAAARSNERFESRTEGSKDGTRTSTDEAKTLGLKVVARIRKVEEDFVHIKAKKQKLGDK